MAQIAVKHISGMPQAVASRLRALRRRMAIWFLVDGLSKLLLLAVAICAVDLLADWAFRWDTPQRGILLVLMIVGLCVAAFWWLIRPFTHRTGDDALCLEVERRFKDLGESLISAVQLARLDEKELGGVSRTLVRATIDYGTRAAERVRFDETLNLKRFYINLLLLAVGIAATAGAAVAVANTEAGYIWFNRNVMLGSATWPQYTYLVVHGEKDGVLTLPRGEDWLQEVEVDPKSERIPPEVYLDFRPSRGRPSQSMRKSDRMFRLEFQNVIEEFQFRARGGDAVTPWIQVRLVEQPAVTDLLLTVTPPPYVSSQEETLERARSPYGVLRGSALKIEGQTNKPIVNAELSLGDQSLPMALVGDSGFAISLTPEELVAGRYLIRLTDSLGLTSKRPTSFEIRIVPDRPPRVTAELLGISGMVVPQAFIPLNARISDDFAVSDVRLTYEWRSSESVSPPESGTVDLGLPEELVGESALELKGLIFDLQPLQIPTNSGLTFHIEADDNDNVSGPNTGRSPEFLVRVVTEEQLRADLLRREKEQRQEFERLLKNQEDALTDAQALQAALTDAPTMDGDLTRSLMDIQRRQKLIGTNTSTISQRLSLFLIESENNRLEEEGGPLHRRLNDNVIVPMIEITMNDSPEAVRSLDKVRRLSEKAADRDEALAEAIAQQEALAAKMREILVHMEKAEGYQEAVNLLYEIEKLQRNVHDLTEKELQDRIRRFLEEGNSTDKPKPEGDDGADSGDSDTNQENGQGPEGEAPAESDPLDP